MVEKELSDLFSEIYELKGDLNAYKTESIPPPPCPHIGEAGSYGACECFYAEPTEIEVEDYDTRIRARERLREIAKNSEYEAARKRAKEVLGDPTPAAIGGCLALLVAGAAAVGYALYKSWSS